ncbi:ACP S-malonyltransferase [Ureibacillus sp. NPDC094379]
MIEVKSAFLFPGQGSQYVGMLNNLPNSKEVKKIIEEATDLLKVKISDLDNESALRKTKAVQLSLLICGVASFEFFKQQGAIPDYVAGHSVGAFSAAVASGVFSFEDALKIVSLRGELMENFYESGFGMGVVLGLDESKLQQIVEQVHSDFQPVYVSNRNAPTQLTISGSINGIQKVINFSQTAGAISAKLLNVSTPSHCPLFDEVSYELLKALNGVAINQPKIPYSSNLRARLLRRGEDIKEDLAFSISRPVLWHEATNVLYENGVRLFIEIPPKEVLSKLAMNAFPESRCMAVSKSGFDDCIYILQN